MCLAGGMHAVAAGTMRVPAQSQKRAASTTELPVAERSHTFFIFICVLTERSNGLYLQQNMQKWSDSLRHPNRHKI
jgi:hypothetical protein